MVALYQAYLENVGQRFIVGIRGVCVHSLAGRIIAYYRRIVHLRIKAPKLAHILIRCCSFEKTIWPNENSRWRPFFKMATSENTVILHSAIKSHKLVLFEWPWCQIIHFSLCRIQIWTHGLTHWLPCTIFQSRNPNILLDMRFTLCPTGVRWFVVYILVLLEV